MRFEVGDNLAALPPFSVIGADINGAKVAEHTLNHGDLVQLGETLMRFQTHAAPAVSTITNLSEPAGKLTAPPSVGSTRELVHDHPPHVVPVALVLATGVPQPDNEQVEHATRPR